MFWHEIEMILLGVLCGSCLFGSYFPKKIKKIDVTEVSSDHNPGTANAMKYAGVPVGILCLVADLMKGALPVYLAIHMGLLTGNLFPLIMAAPVFGHAYSLFHHGKGGKAIAVSFGVLIGLLPTYYELLFLLCALYIFCSLIVVIRPHTRRTRITFWMFSAGALGLLVLGKVPLSICVGALLSAVIVIHKNSIRAQQQEALDAKREASLEIL